MKKFSLILFILLFLTIFVFASSIEKPLDDLNNNTFSPLSTSFLIFCLLKLNLIKNTLFLLGMGFFFFGILVFILNNETSKKLKLTPFTKMLFCLAVIFWLVVVLLPSTKEALVTIKNLNILNVESFNNICLITNNEKLMIEEVKDKTNEKEQKRNFEK